MAKKEKKTEMISVNKWESMIEENTVSMKLGDEEGLALIVRIRLGLKEMLELVETVVASVIDRDDGSYIPEIKDFATRREILSRYANIRMPASADKQYDLIYGTELFSMVADMIDKTQYEEMRKAIDGRIDHELAMMHAELAEKTGELLSIVEELAGQMELAFGALDGDDISNALKALAGTTAMDEDRLAQAVMARHREEILAGEDENEDEEEEFEEEEFEEDESKVVRINKKN